MSGTNYLLDTNIFLGVLKQSEPAMKKVESVPFDECGFSVVTRMELLGFTGILKEECDDISEMLSHLTCFALNDAVEKQVIAIRQQRKVKLPDAIVAATALVNNLELVTLDQKLGQIYAQCK